ncbi:glutathione S-transferase family protein [Burkholderia sp. L27(2015)]|uniref:glutathione S-transferase family protein n=1 Tax=Burkholderia sp. L27(2015) TaxID=1641858 RepID=UPI001576340C|nr:glutathione S-transferase N-terminal domain-containing protein [Burkholderia sp. L27(2015)]
MMKLIGSLASPYVRKVRIVMAEKKVEYHLQLEDVWADDTTIRDFNPLGKIPCLLLEDGEAVFDSRVISEYLDTLTPVGKLIPPSGRERVEVRCWEALCDGVIDAGMLIQQENSMRASAERSAAWVARQRRKVVDGLAAIAHGLAEKPWCASNHLTLADISVCCALGWLALNLPEIDWRTDYPNLDRHYEKLMQRQSFADTAPQL